MQIVDWLKLHKVIVAIVLVLLLGSGTVAAVATKRRQAKDRLIAQQQLEATSKIQVIEVTPSPILSPSPSVAPAQSPSIKPSPKQTLTSIVTNSTPSPSPISTNQSSPSPAHTSAETTNSTPSPTSTTVRWNYTGSTWEPSGKAPACPNPMTLNAPTDLTKVISILYPGQTRGGDYKAHGGFRFENSTDGAVTVRAPYEAQIVKASRYIESGEVQYLFEFQNSCGVAYRFDHLKTLSPALQAVADKLPEAKVDDSRSTDINPPVAVATNETLATNVGFVGNTSFDWGVYDLRTKNSGSQGSNELANYGVCWFDWLSEANEAIVRGLPATADNKTSDYCK